MESETAQDDDHVAALPRGSTLFEYRIKSVLGQGGFGVTYLAEDTLLDEPVAIKEFFPSHTAVRDRNQSVRARTVRESESLKEGVEAFLLEARIIARFRHPNIMQVRRYFEANGTGYMVLDFITGRPLEDAMRDGPLPDPVIRTVLAGILDGLSVVHDRAILHRDLKPRNVILREDDRPVLIDFGSARDFGARDSGTVTQIVSPGYSAPEQYGVGDQGPWSDFYSLGAILYRAVTGRAPLDSLRRLGSDPLQPASVVAAGTYDPALLELVDRLLSIDPTARPASSAAVNEILSVSVSDPLVTPTVGKTADRVGKEAGVSGLRRITAKPATLAGAACLFAILIVVLAVSLVRFHPSPKPSEALAPHPAAPVAPEIRTKPDSDLAPGTEFKDCADCPKMKVLAATTFAMGSDDGPEDQRPVHQVTFVRPFAIGIKEVTIAEWKACVADNGCSVPFGFKENRANSPVLNVTWLEAKRYVSWLDKKTGASYRLPSEAQWEYAARGGTTTPFWWGDAIGKGHANCSTCGNGPQSSASDVGSFAPNPFGLYDTAGNAAEWVEDCWAPDYKNAASDGTPVSSPGCARHVIRGGSFDSSPRYLRSAARSKYDTAVPFYTNGLRVVRELSRS